MMLSLFRLEHLGQDHVFIYLIKIPLPALTKGYLSRQSVHPGFFFLSLNSKDYLCWLAIEVGWMGARVSMESIGLSEYWLVCCPPWLQARYHHCLPSGSGTELFYLYRRFYHSSRGVWEHNYSVIMVVTTLLRHNLYCWPTNKWPLCATVMMLILENAAGHGTKCIGRHESNEYKSKAIQTHHHAWCHPAFWGGGVVTCCNISPDDQTGLTWKLSERSSRWTASW